MTTRKKTESTEEKPSGDAVFSVRLPDDLDQRLRKCASEFDLSKNDIARHAIRAALDAIERSGYRIPWPMKMHVEGDASSPEV
jgi:hypothetical protein